VLLRLWAAFLLTRFVGCIHLPRLLGISVEERVTKADQRFRCAARLGVERRSPEGSPPHPEGTAIRAAWSGPNTKKLLQTTEIGRDG
jgi:hypothetical protein